MLSDFMSKVIYDRKLSGKFYVERKPKEIAELLVKICEENDDGVGQAIVNALELKYDDKIPDIFGIEDKKLLEVLRFYYKDSVKRN